MYVAPRDTSTLLPEPYEIRPSQEWDGNDGSWSTFKIAIGNPPQEFRVLASTQSGQTFVVTPEGCLAGIDPADCAKSRGAQVFNSAQSPGFLTNESSTWEMIGTYQINLESALNYTARGLFGYDKVTLGPGGTNAGLSVDSQIVTGVADRAYYLGHLPLGVTKSKFASQGQSTDSLIYHLRNSSQIPSMSFSYTAGAKYRLKSVVGQLILGGYDPGRFEPNSNGFSFSFSTDPSRLFTVMVESMMATNTLLGTRSLSSSAHLSLIDSTVSHLWLPRGVCDEFEKSFGLTYDPNTDLYLINATMRDQLLARDASVTIKLVDSLESAATNFTNLVLPYAAFDLQAPSLYYNSTTNYFPIRRAANESQFTLGRTLLQEAYLIVDYERHNFTVAQAVFPNPLPAADIQTIYPPGYSLSSSHSSLSTGAKAGIAVGSVLLVLIFVALAFLFYRRRCRQPPVASDMIGHPTAPELGGNAVSEFDAVSTVSPHPHKFLDGTQELGGTPCSELGGTLYSELPSPFPEKSYVSVNEVPQELEIPASTIRPKFEEITADEFSSYRSKRDSDRGSDSVRVSVVGSQVSDEATHKYVISPLAGNFEARRSVVSPLVRNFDERIS